MLSPEQTVIEFIEAWSRMDFDRVHALMAEDIVYHNMPWAPINGREAARAFFDSFPAEAIEWTILNIAANGNIVLTERIDRFLRSEGVLSVPVMGTFEVRQGLIKHWRDYFDPNSISNYKPRSEAVGWGSAHDSG